mgnify:FL=1
MGKKTIVARVKILAEKQAAFLNATEVLIQETRAEKGNISYTLYQSTENPSDFIFYEEYKDENAMSVHATSEHFKSFVETIDGMLAEEMVIESF